MPQTGDNSLTLVSDENGEQRIVMSVVMEATKNIRLYSEQQQKIKENIAELQQEKSKTQQAINRINTKVSWYNLIAVVQKRYTKAARISREGKLDSIKTIDKKIEIKQAELNTVKDKYDEAMRIVAQNNHSPVEYTSSQQETYKFTDGKSQDEKYFEKILGEITLSEQE